MGQNIISWSSKKQDTVSKSSTEAEYRCMSDTSSEILWLCSILREIGAPLPDTPELYCDNLSAIYLTANPAFHAKTKHFALHYHFVRERVALKALIVKHIPSHLQITDIFTKSLPQKAFEGLRYKFGVDFPPTQSLRGNDNTTGKKTEFSSASNDVASGKGVVGQNNKSKPIPKQPMSKPVWVKRLSSSPTAASDASHLKDKTRDYQKLLVSPEDCTDVKLANRFSALDVECEA